MTPARRLVLTLLTVALASLALYSIFPLTPAVHGRGHSAVKQGESPTRGSGLPRTRLPSLAPTTTSVTTALAPPVASTSTTAVPSVPSPSVPPWSDATTTQTADWACIAKWESTDRANDPAAPSGLYGIEPSSWHAYGYAGWPYQYPASVQSSVALRIFHDNGDRFAGSWSTAGVCGVR